MDNKAQIEAILKQRFFVTPTGYPSQNGFLDYGPPLAQTKLQILAEFRRIFIDEDTYEMEPSAMLPYEVLKNSGHIDKFCDVILTDGTIIVRADHYIEDTVGEVLSVPVDLAENYALIVERVETLKKEIIIEKNSRILRRKEVEKISKAVASISISADQSSDQFTREEVGRILSNFQCCDRNLADLNKSEIDFIVFLHNLHSPDGKPFNPSKDYNLIFKLNDRQFLRPEIAQSQFTNFRKIFDLNNEKLPFSSLAIGRSYRNEISARGGMLRTKEFEQAEIEYFSEDGKHSGFEGIRNTEIFVLPNHKTVPFKVTIGEAFNSQIISSEAICFFIAKAQEFLLCIGFKLESLRYRQHNPNEMAHYANDCWDVEIKTMSGWVECAGIADRGCFDLTCHSKDVNANVKKLISPKEIYKIELDRQVLGKTLRSRAKDLETVVSNMSQEEITGKMENNKIKVMFEGEEYEFAVSSRTVDFEFFIPKVIEPSFGISRILYSLVEQSFNIRDDRNVLSLPPKMCFLHCMITYLKYSEEYAPILEAMRADLRRKSIRFRINDRSCSIGKKYSSCDEIGVPFFVTFDFETPRDGCVTVRDRDSTTQIRVKPHDVAAIIDDLIAERVEWASLLQKFGIKK